MLAGGQIYMMYVSNTLTNQSCNIYRVKRRFEFAPGKGELSLAVCANLTWELSLLDYVDSKFHEK